MSTVLVSGANGLVGSYVVRELKRRGHTARRLIRSSTTANDVQFSLGEIPPHAAFEGVDTLIHCAYDFNAFGWDEIRRVNVEGSLALLKAAHLAGVREIIFISSIAAFDGCKSLYGRGKLEAERYLVSIGGVNVRPGLIYGDSEGRGMFGSLARIVRLPAVPVFGDGAQPFYLVHVQDLALALVEIVERYGRFGGKTITAADPTPVAFGSLLKRIAREMTGREPVTVPVPAVLGLAALKALEAVGLRPRFRSDSLISMISYDPCPDFSSAREHGLTFRAF